MWFIDIDYPFLSASPVGLLGNDKIIEVKCVPFIGEISLNDAVSNRKLKFCSEHTDCMTIQKQDLNLKKHIHIIRNSRSIKYYTKKSTCYIFILFNIGNNIFV